MAMQLVDVRRPRSFPEAGAGDEGSVERNGLEQFRRAIVERDQDAWCAVHRRYSGMVRLWVRGGMDPEADVAATFERFCRALDAAKLERFGSLASIVAFLRQCARSAVLDAARARRSDPITLDPQAVQELRSGDDVEAEVEERAAASLLWQAVEAALTDERERLVVYLSCAIGHSPRQILARHPALFEDIGAVYRLKRCALDKLRQQPAIQALRRAPPARPAVCLPL